MRSFTTFIALWQHRYRKYSYIFLTYCKAYMTIIRFWFLKKQKNKNVVVIIRTEHFGDIVAAEPIARQVRRLHPSDYLIWLVKPAFASLVETHPNLDAVWQQTSVLHRKIVCQSGVFDKVYNLEFWQSNFDTRSGYVHENPVAVKNGVTIHNYFDKGNLLTIFQLCADLPVQDEEPRVYVSETDRQLVADLALPQPLVVIHCSSNFSPKDWSKDNWEKVCRWLIDKKGFYVAEIGLKNVVEIKSSNYLNLCGRFTILQTAEIIRHAQLYIGIDSGPAHLANAVGTFGIILLGKLNDFETYQPYSGKYLHSNHARLLSQPPKTCAELPYDWVQNEVEKILLDISVKAAHL
ncbi:MAG: glycosyltransferase family 9 protein [Runella sp.]